MAHGYAKVARKPMAAMVHSTVGLQHASMAMYNAYADRAPILVISGNMQNTAARRPNVEWNHAALDQNALLAQVEQRSHGVGSDEAETSGDEDHRLTFLS